MQYTTNPVTSPQTCTAPRRADCVETAQIARMSVSLQLVIAIYDFHQSRDPALDYTKVEPNTPILVGSGQITQRIPEDLATVLGPIDLMMESVQRAATDAGLEHATLRTADSLRVVHFITGVYEDPVGLLAQRLGVSAQDTMYTSVGGNSPQMLVNATAEALSEGRIRLAILVGVEALGSTIAAMKQGITPVWVERDGAGPGGEPPSAETPVRVQVLVPRATV